MVEASLKVSDPSGFHARPAALFAQTAASFTADISVVNETRDATKAANAKSVLSILGLAIVSGSRITIRAEGDDEDAALQALVSALEAGIGELL